MRPTASRSGTEQPAVRSESEPPSAEWAWLRALEKSADGIIAFDTQLRYTVWNAGMERLTGVRANEVLGREALEVFPFLAETGEDHFFREALAGRSVVSHDRWFEVPSSGRRGYFDGYYSSVQDSDGRIVGGLAIVHDVTARKQAELERLELARAEAARSEAEAAARRFAFLAEAGEAFSSSLDYEQTLRDVARLALPVLGDLCIVDVVEDGRLRRVATAHVNPAKMELLEQLRLRYAPSEHSPQPAARVLRSGEPELIPEVTPEVVAEHTLDPAHAHLIRGLGMRSHLAVPLVARGTTLGVLSLGITESDRRYGPADEALAIELARRAALAVDNARLYRAAQDELAERRRAEDALRFSEGRFRAVMEQSPLSKQIFRADGTSVRVNKAWEKLWGVTLDDIPEYNVLHDPQLEAHGVAALIRRAFAGESVEIPAIRYDPNESIPDKSQYADPVRWVRAFAYPIKDAEGQVREVVLVHEDVTAREHAEARLRASEERLRMALSAARMIVWDRDLVTGRVECSEGAHEFWGLEVGHADDFLAVVHPDDRALVDEAAHIAQSGAAPYRAEYRLLREDGRLRWVQSRGRVETGADGKPARLVGVTVDITDLKMAEAATRVLADAGETLGASLDTRLLLQNLTRVIVPRLADWCSVDLLTEAGTLERASLEHPNPDRVALWTELFERFPPRPSDPYGAWRVIETRKPEWSDHVDDASLRSVAHDRAHLGLLRELGLRSYICVPLIARDVVIGVLTLALAESGRRYAESDVALAQDLARRAAAAVENARLYERLRAEDRRKDEFLATLAHELRNPLAPIRTGLEILRVAQPGTSTEKTRDMMERQLAHMVRLIDDLLDVARVTRGKVQLHKERLDLWSIVGTALEASRPLIDAAGIELVVRLPEQPVVLEADRTRLAQVLSNLVNNAAKYTERGGRIEIDAQPEVSGVVIRVKDTGIGIPREMLAQVFEMFAQVGRSLERSQGGLGIGLTLVKSLVELHGGQVWAESDGPGRGSTFLVRLPVASATTKPLASVDAEVADAETAARRVLVVDDNVDAAEALALLLELDGHEVRTAASGPEALEVVASFQPDVAFLDIGLPGMTGYELARELRCDLRLAGTMLVALTGWGQPEDRRRSKEAGFDHHLVKPVRPKEVQRLLQQPPRR